MEKELILRWTKTKPLTRQGRGKEEETASVASLFVLFKFKPLSKNGECYNVSEVIIASAMVADLISKLRGINNASKSTPLAEETPQPDQPIAA